MANSASSNELHSITKHNNIVISGVGGDRLEWTYRCIGETRDDYKTKE